jgi:tetratricopeptide (TPR) repeat protein
MKTALTILTLMLCFGLTLTGCNSVWVTSAKVYLQQNNLDKARDMLLQGLEENPKDAQAHYLLGDIYAQQKNYPDMLKEFETSLSLNQKFKPDIDATKNKIYRALYTQAVEDFNNKAPDKAAELLTTALTISPQERAGWSLLGKANINQKKYPQAIEALNKVVALDPKFEAMDDRGWLMKMYYASEKYNESLTVAQQILAKDPSNKEAVRYLADSYSEMAKRESDPDKKAALMQSALDYYTKEIANNPNDPDLHYNLGALHEKLGDLNGAQQEYQKCFDLNPKDKDAILRVASIYILKSESDTTNAFNYYKSSIDGYKKYLELDPANDKIWTALGSVQIQIGSILETRAAAMEEQKNVTAAMKKDIQAMKAEAKGWVDDGKVSLQKADAAKTQK